MMNRLHDQTVRIVTAGLLISACTVAGCGAASGLGATPEDCIVFLSRSEVLDLFEIATDERDDGSSVAEAFARVTAACVDDRCEGDDPIGVCAVSCASCADALTEIAYDQEQ